MGMFAMCEMFEMLGAEGGNTRGGECLKCLKWKGDLEGEGNV